MAKKKGGKRRWSKPNSNPFKIIKHPQAAKLKAFRTTKLLEQILLHTQFKDLLHAQQVCRFFRNAIDDSPKLQMRIFMLADKDIEPRYWIYTPDKRIAEYKLRPNIIPKDHIELGFRFVCNPLLLEPGPSLKILRRVGPPPASAGLRKDIWSLNDAIHHPSADFFWDMLLTQPPLTSLRLAFSYHLDKFSNESASTVRVNSNGVRYGDIAGRMVRIVKYLDAPISRVQIYRHQGGRFCFVGIDDFGMP